MAYANLGDPTESPLLVLVREALEHVTLGTTVQPLDKAPSRAKEPTTGYLKNAEGTYRKAPRGKPRRGEVKVDLTEAEVADLREQDLVTDPE